MGWRWRPSSGDRRARFESETGTRISSSRDPGSSGTPPGARRTSIVAVWPEVGDRTTLQGFDLTSEPVRRSALQRARATRRTVLTRDTPFVLGGRGFRPSGRSMPPRGPGPGRVRERVVQPGRCERVLAAADRRAPASGWVTPSCSRRRSLLERRHALDLARWPHLRPHHARARLALLVDRNPPRWAVLALMLATFTWARISSERRLVRAHDASAARDGPSSSSRSPRASRSRRPPTTWRRRRWPSSRHRASTWRRSTSGAMRRQSGSRPTARSRISTSRMPPLRRRWWPA